MTAKEQIMFEAAILAIVSLSADPAVRMDTTQSFPCDPIPANADQACVACMKSACDELRSSIEACGDAPECIDAARIVYRINLSLCPTCNPVAMSTIAGLAALPHHLRADFLTLWSIATEHNVAGTIEEGSGPILVMQ